MLTIICGLLTGIGVYFALAKGANMSDTMSIVLALLSMFLVQVIAMLVLRKVSAGINGRLQLLMGQTSEKIRAMQNQFMRRPMGNQKMMMQAMEKEQNAGLQKMIEALELYRPLYLWNILMKRQVNTMKMLFLFQMKKFEEADALMPKCLFYDVQSVCVKMARMYRNNEEGIDKFFKRKGARFKGQDAVLPYSLYAWILVKQDKVDEAVKVLVQAKIKTMDHEVIVKNWEMLVNGKVKHFSNSQLGEAWYALMLEEPKMPRVQQQQVRYRR